MFRQSIEVEDVPVIIQRRGVRRHFCRGAEADSHGPVQETIDILQLQYTDKVIDVFCAGPVLECRRGEDSRAPTVALVFFPGQGR